jgi:hypothetical protein
MFPGDTGLIGAVNATLILVEVSTTFNKNHEQD